MPPTPPATALVLDGSVAVAWCFADEADPYADAVARALPHLQVIVAGLWHLEVANALLMGERRKRSSPAERRSGSPTCAPCRSSWMTTRRDARGVTRWRWHAPTACRPTMLHTWNWPWVGDCRLPLSTGPLRKAADASGIARYAA
jgi:hypothetical protein